MSVAAVVVAAGSGERFGSEERKQFVELAGEPVAARACRPFLEDPRVGEVVLVLPPAIAGDPPDWVGRMGVRIAAGGSSRRESVARGLAELAEDVDTVLVHDGVRPLATRDLVRRVLDATGRGAAVPVLPLRDTVKEVEGDRVVKTLDRSRLRRVQTPQGFALDALLRAHREAEASARATDDASLLEAVGTPVRTVPGEESNLKITTREDLARAAWLLDAAGAGAGAAGDAVR